jgi:hypothetical protein
MLNMREFTIVHTDNPALAQKAARVFNSPYTNVRLIIPAAQDETDERNDRNR